ncbi:hypothetical protein OB13_03275 [Pontibacter sp. HJ8]
MEAEFYNEQPQGLNINLDSKTFLLNTAKWGKFLAIVGFVFVGLMVAGGLFASTVLGAMGEGAGLGGSAMGSAFFGVFYLLFALLYFFPVLYLYKFSSKMKIALSANNEELVSESFKSLKSLFKFMGVLTIVMLVAYALALLAVAFGAALGTSL